MNVPADDPPAEAADPALRALRSAAARDRFIVELVAATRPLEDPQELMRTTARLLAEHLGADRCAYAVVEDEQVFDITGDYHRGVPSIVGRWAVAAFGPECVRTMREGEPYVVDDSHRHPGIDETFRAAYDATQIRAVVCVPLHKNGRFTAAMAVHQASPRAWTADEVALITFVVARCWETLERVRVERELRESEARYRLMVNASPDCVKLVSADGSLLQINKAGLDAIEATDEQSVLGACVYDLVVPEQRADYRAFNERICRGATGSLQFELVGLRGTRRTLEITANPLATPSGGFAALGIARDVTARVAAEHALAESRARLDYAVRLSRVGFWYCDLPFDELEWDARVREHFFLPSTGRVTIHTFYERILLEDREATRRAIDASIERRESYDVVYRTVNPATGELKWIRALGGATYDAQGRPNHFDGVTVDVSEAAAQQERLAKLNAQLRDQERRKDEFLATLAHELRNPLAPMRTGLGILRQSTSVAQTERVRAMLDRQLDHLVRLVDDLLDLSRITQGRVTLKRERVHVQRALEDTLDAIRPIAEQAKHSLVVDFPAEPLMVDADPTRLAQIVANLLHNAVKYTTQGGAVGVSGESRDGWLVLSVRDNGVGIPADMLPRVFEPFTQVGRALERTQGGLGIGLSLVKRLVELHGGSVRAESGGPGLGSTFSVHLPLIDVAPTEADAPAEVGDGKALRVLVVDDNEDGAEALAMMLELHGYTPAIANSGEQALELVEGFVPQVAFLDIGMPGMNGYELAQRLRQDPRLSSCQLFALTGWGAENDKQRAKDAGFDRHFTKPIDMDEMLGVLGTL